MLFDAPYAELEKFTDWIARRPDAFFVSAYGAAAANENATLQRLLTERGAAFRTRLPKDLARGAAFIRVADAIKHEDFMTLAWVRHPLRDLLRRLPGFSRAGGAPSRKK
jgi:hypothetical protein